MTPQREVLDDTIDRVAAELTAVAADPALAGRITARLESLPRSTPGWRLAIGAAATAAAAMVAAFVLNAPPSPAIDDEPTAHPVSLPVLSPAVSVPLTAAPAPMVPTGARVGRIAREVRRANARDLLPEFQQIDALSSPAILAVEDLSTDPLTVLPVDVSPLHLADLVIGEVSGREEPKE